jgi:hypothetical protein
MRRLRDLHESGGESLWIITCIQTSHSTLFFMSFTLLEFSRIEFLMRQCQHIVNVILFIFLYRVFRR